MPKVPVIHSYIKEVTSARIRPTANPQSRRFSSFGIVLTNLEFAGEINVLRTAPYVRPEYTRVYSLGITFR